MRHQSYLKIRLGQPMVVKNDVERTRTPFNQIDASIRRFETFGFESTLSGSSHLNLMKRALESGYDVKLAYVGVDDPMTLVERGCERFSSPERVRNLAIRWRKSLDHLPQALANSSRAILFDNSIDGSLPRPIAYSARSAYIPLYAMPAWCDALDR